MNKNKRNSGFSIMETVVALAIIVLVTVAALSVVMAAISARVKVNNYSEAQDFAHNALECFKVADDNAEFENNLDFAGYERENLSEANSNEYTYVAENKFSADITANVTTGEFEITVEDNKGEEIISFSYTKGAKQ